MICPKVLQIHADIEMTLVYSDRCEPLMVSKEVFL